MALPSTANEVSPLTPSLTAGVLLLARALSKHTGLTHPGVDEICQTTGAGRTRAYARKRQIARLIAQLQKRPGRPETPAPVAPARSDIERITRRVLRYVMRHPGAVSGATARRRYSHGFRRLVVDLCGEQAESDRSDLSAIADAIDIPLSTLRSWLRRARDADDIASRIADELTDELADELADHRDLAHSHRDSARLDVDDSSRLDRRIRREWALWRGGFGEFCNHLAEHCRVSLPRATIAHIVGEDHAPRHPSRATVAQWRNHFERFFPGAQWVGDGTQLTVWLDDEPFRFNLELMVDTASSAIVGASIRDEEDGSAVVEAFHDGVATTGAPPLAVLLDNRPSNHSAQVASALDPTLRIRAAPGRPQSKAHVEGAFGLFAQTAPALRVTQNPGDRRGLARQLLGLVITTWARTLNGRRRERGRVCSRLDQYRHSRTDVAVKRAARAALQSRACHRSRRRRAERHPLGPFVRSALERLGLSTRDRSQLLTRVWHFPDPVIVDSIACFAARRDAGTLPSRAGGRYFMQLLRQHNHAREGAYMVDALWQTRCAANDALLAALARQRAQIERGRATRDQRLFAMLDHAASARSTWERAFWLDAACAVTGHRSRSERRPWYDRAARYILALTDIPYRVRLTLIYGLAARFVPVMTTRS